MSAPQATPCPECGGLYPVIDCHNCRGGSGTATSSEPWWESPLEFKREWSASGKKLKENLSSSSTCNAETQVAAAPAAEPDNLVARLREMRTVYMSPASADSRTLAEAADRIEALEAKRREQWKDLFGKWNAAELQLQELRHAEYRLRAERDAALTKVTELEAELAEERRKFTVLDEAVDLTVRRLRGERDAALARANEAERWMRHTSECAAKRPIGGDCGCGLNDWLRRSQETP